MGLGTRLVWRANPAEWQLLPSLWIQRLSSAASAAPGLTILAIGSVFRIRIAPSRVVSVARREFVVRRIPRGEAAVRGGEGFRGAKRVAVVKQVVEVKPLAEDKRGRSFAPA